MLEVLVEGDSPGSICQGIAADGSQETGGGHVFFG